MNLRVAVLKFPGSNCDLDVVHVLRNVIGIHAELVWHKEFTSNDWDAVILPGGFSYGDYLRAGIIAAHSPAMKHVKEMAKEGKPVLGICNGFQILVEAGLLPGSLLPNNTLTFICKWVNIRTETNRTAFTRKIKPGTVLKIPIAHKEGRYYIDEKELRELEENDQIVFRYCDENGNLSEDANPNGSIGNIAGVTNLEGNVVGLMPHPERASEKILSPYGTEDGKLLFLSMVETLRRGAL